MPIQLWKGFHSPELPDLISKAWQSENLLILCPPGLHDFSFLGQLPSQPVETVGEWDAATLSLLAQASKGPRAPHHPGYPDVPVLGVFTSGTVSGEPRLILYSKANIHAALAGVRSFFDVSKIEALFCYPQPFHTFGLILGYVQALLFDLDLIFLPGRYSRPAHQLRASLENPRLLTLGTPTHFHDLIEYVRHEKISIHPSYTSVSGGAKTSVALWQSMRDDLKIESPSIGYGASEAAPAMTHLPPGRVPVEDGEIGFPIPGLTLKVLPGQGVEFTGPNVCLAVIQAGRIEFPEKVLIRDEVELRATDQVFLYRGRYELLLNRGGSKFSLEKIQEAIFRNFQLESVCVALPDERLGEELGVLVKSPAEKPFEKDLIAAMLKSEFGASFNPRYISATPEIPLNPNGKVSRIECARLLRGELAYPVSVERISQWLPHKAPAIWIDEVNWVKGAGENPEGECSVCFDPAANYASHGRLRQSSLMEWIAQAYGYVSTCLSLSQAPEDLKKPAKTYLVAITNVIWSEVSTDTVRSGDTLRIRVRKTHQMGPLAVVEGSVLNSSDHVMAKAQIKIFAE